MKKKLKIRVVDFKKNGRVCIIIPVWFFQIVSNYKIINGDNQIFGNRNNGICLLKKRKNEISLKIT